MKHFILDVDGVLTDGKFYYTSEGKIMKKFGPDDNDALSLLDPYLKIEFVTADKRGFAISKKRIEEDMKRKITLVSSFERLSWIKKRYKLEEVIYMGDGIFDYLVFKKVGYSIAPLNAAKNTKETANWVVSRSGGDRAVSEAVIHILKTFFGIENLTEIIKKQNGFGEWEKQK
jgi:3-deoxy-D-manno-octulosonate 8-phosphate phosphatase (KDO 8-P phosphatase)